MSRTGAQVQKKCFVLTSDVIPGKAASDGTPLSTFLNRLTSCKIQGAYHLFNALGVDQVFPVANDPAQARRVLPDNRKSGCQCLDEYIPERFFQREMEKNVSRAIK